MSQEQSLIGGCPLLRRPIPSVTLTCLHATLDSILGEKGGPKSIPTACFFGSCPPAPPAQCFPPSMIMVGPPQHGRLKCERKQHYETLLQLRKWLQPFSRLVFHKTTSLSTSPHRTLWFLLSLQQFIALFKTGNHSAKCRKKQNRFPSPVCSKQLDLCVYFSFASQPSVAQNLAHDSKQTIKERANYSKEGIEIS